MDYLLGARHVGRGEHRRLLITQLSTGRAKCPHLSYTLGIRNPRSSAMCPLLHSLVGDMVALGASKHFLTVCFDSGAVLR